MIRNLKSLGLALCATLALTAVVASAALAGTYTAASYPASGTATNAFSHNTFITEAGAVECGGHFTGSLSWASPHLTITPTYTNCKFSAYAAIVDMNGCTYTLGAPAKVSTDNYFAPVQIICPAANRS